MELTQPEPLVLGTNPAAGWKDFKQRFTFYSEGTGLDKKANKMQCAVLMHVIGKEGQEVYKTFTFDTDTEGKYEPLIKKFDAVFLPKTNVTYERFLFNTCVQKSGQAFDSFVTELRGLAKTCDYETLSDSLIKDRIIVGIRDKRLQKKLLASDPGLDDAIEGCRVSEISERQAGSMERAEKETTVEEEVHKVRVNNGKQYNNYRANFKETRANEQQCFYCGRSHQRGTKHCPAYGTKCDKCDKMNHFSSVCRFRPIRNVNVQRSVVDTEESTPFFIGAVHTSLDDHSGWKERINIGGHGVTVKVDPGAEVNTMSLSTYRGTGGDVRALKPTNAVLIGYSGKRVKPAGEVTLPCIIRGKTYEVPIYITEQDLPNLLGRVMCEKAKLVQRINHLDTNVPLTNESIMQKFPDTFKGLGCLPYTHTISLKSNTEPVINAPRRIPLKLKPLVVAEIQRLESLGVVKPVIGPTEWVNHLVIVNKPDGSIRLCMDANALNDAIIPSRHKLNTVEEIAAEIPDAKLFSKFDASTGFWQIKLDEASSKYCTVNTPIGRYRFTRLPFGVLDASEVFQKVMEEIFGDIAHILVDDILVSGKTRSEHDDKVIQVMNRAREANLKFNPKKLVIGTQELPYAGHRLTSEGLKPDPKKVKAITNMPEPKNKSQLKSLLGMVQYLTKFLPKLSNKSATLRELLKENVEFVWDTPQAECFKVIKQLVTEDAALSYYDVNKSVTLQVDASKNGLGACLMQEGKPILYASTSLTETQQRYAQIEKEMLAVVFACKKFHDYIYSKPTKIHTDHKPLQTIFKKSLGACPPRIARMMLGLQKYQLEVTWKPGKEMYVADALSRNYIDDEDEELDSKEYDIEVNALVKNLPVSAAKYAEFQTETGKDPEAKKLKEVLLKGWPTYHKDLHHSLKPFWTDRSDFFLNDGIIYKSQRLYIPKSMRKQMLILLHEGHFGIQKTLNRAATILYWPGISKDIEDMVKTCDVCIRHRRGQQKEPMISHEIPARPWQEVGIDFLEVDSKKWMVVVDFYSSFFEMVSMQYNTRAPTVILHLKSIFARHGVPEIIFSDNGPPYDSNEFAEFAKEYNISLKTSSPDYPQSNGKVESAVDAAKQILKKATDQYAALMEYRASPITGIGKSPAELLFGRAMRTKLPCSAEMLNSKQSMTEVVREKMKINKDRQKHYYDRNAGPELPELEDGEEVHVRRGKEWKPAKVIRKSEIRSYQIQPETGQEVRRNRRYLLRSHHD